MGEGKIVRTICGNCIGCCGALVQVEDGRIVKAQGDPEHPFSRGGLTSRARLYHRSSITRNGSGTP